MDSSQTTLTKLWQSRALKYPMLYSVYKFLGAMPAAATPCQRVFSQSGFEITARRDRLSPEIIEFFFSLHLQSQY